MLIDETSAIIWAIKIVSLNYELANGKLAMSMKKMQQESYLYGSNAVFIEELYARYLKDEKDVDENWRNWFSELRNGGLAPDQDHLAIQAQMKSAATSKKVGSVVAGSGQQAHQSKQVFVLQLINAYRIKGHQKAKLDT